MTDQQEHLPLGDSARDRLGRGVAAVAGLVPGLGPLIQYAITELIPSERLNRIETFLLHLNKRMDRASFNAAVNNPEGLDLFEEGLWQSARALNDDRRRYIAELVASGMAEDAAKQEQTRHFLRLLGQIGDSQIIILTSYLPQYRALGSPLTKEFYERHREVLGPFSREIGGNNPDAGRAEHKDALERHLSSLGLLTVVSEDYNGRPGRPGSVVQYDLTPQGRQFLQHLGVAEG